MDGGNLPQRKACDLCYRRKIKCDGQKPLCTTCVVHKSDCTYNAASRKAPSRKQAAIQRQRREYDLQSRVETLEQQLSTVLKKVDRLERKQDTPSSATPAYSEDAARVANQSLGLPDLPSLQEVLPVVERYLATFNSILPLFHPATLLQTVKNWYQNPHSRDPVTWAIINVVLAVIHHTSGPNDWLPIGNTATYLNNIKSVLTEIIMRDTGLANVQIVLGLAILFWSAEDSGPALILIGTALRLAHSLGLHTRKSSRHYSSTLALQRTRVFWIAYILDRDISLQSKLAPVQLDSDIDLDLPPSEAEDDLAGFVFAADGQTKINYFRARVELARIQGYVYDSIYSVSAQNQSSEERAQSTARIIRLLDDWSSRIPLGFHSETLSQSNYPELSRYFCILYSTRLSCRALLSYGSASDSYHYSEWMQRLQDYGGEVATGHVISRAPVPHGWQTLADVSREYIRLFRTVTSMDTFFMRLTFCAYTSSLISLVANVIFNANHNTVELDREIIMRAMKSLEDMAEKSGSTVRDVLKRLWSCVDLISGQSTLPNQPISPSMSFLEGASFTEPPEYQYLENDVIIPSIDLDWIPLSDGRI